MKNIKKEVLLYVLNLIKILWSCIKRSYSFIVICVKYCLCNVWLCIVLYFIVAFYICSYVPDYYLEKYQTSTYMESGQIGDIIGGTTGPLIAIIASIFTFLAFWMQYKANEQQRNDISLDHFESNFYEMLHIHRTNLKDLQCGKQIGRDAVYSYCYKLKTLYYLVHVIVTNLSDEDKQLFSKFFYEQKFKSLEECETIIAYNIFFSGADFPKVYTYSSIAARLYNKLIGIIENYESSRLRINENVVYNEFIFSRISDDIYPYITTSKVSLDNSTQLDLLPDSDINIPDSLLVGYNDKLGIYFRQLYQIVKYVNQKEKYTEDKKYFYLRIIRSQLSDYEQILLYYNGLSFFGKAWNTMTASNNNSSTLFKHNDLDKWKDKMGMIARYRLIKNIPTSFRMFGYVPEIKYHEEIKVYKQKGINFFEFERILIE